MRVTIGVLDGGFAQMLQKSQDNPTEVKYIDQSTRQNNKDKLRVYEYAKSAQYEQQRNHYDSQTS